MSFLNISYSSMLLRLAIPLTGPVLSTVRLPLFLFCRSAAIGYLLVKPQILHFLTRTSAQDFFPPLLLFSISIEQVDPSVSIVSQFLHIECFIAGDMRICALREIDRRSDTRRRDAGSNTDLEDSCELFAAVVAGVARALECRFWVARYVAAWYRYDALQCKTLFGMLPVSFDDFAFAFVMVIFGHDIIVPFVPGASWRISY
jgi:hypothetical protein